MEEKNQEIEVQERLSQVSTQAALIAGFAFTGLTLDSGQELTIARIVSTILISLTMGLEILALCLAGFLIPYLKSSPKLDKKWKKHYDVCWFGYLIGLICFLLSLPFVVWAKSLMLAIPVAIMAIVILVIIFKHLPEIVKKGSD
jgi:vacuolar-type H+-ATPase subunit I/STV1